MSTSYNRPFSNDDVAPIRKHDHNAINAAKATAAEIIQMAFKTAEDSFNKEAAEKDSGRDRLRLMRECYIPIINELTMTLDTLARKD